MILTIRVTPKASRSLIKKEDGHLKAYLTKPAHDGLANLQLIELLSEYLSIAKSRIKIIRGHKSRDKLIEINA